MGTAEASIACGLQAFQPFVEGAAERSAANGKSAGLSGYRYGTRGCVGGRSSRPRGWGPWRGGDAFSPASAPAIRLTAGLFISFRNGFFPIGALWQLYPPDVDSAFRENPCRGPARSVRGQIADASRKYR